MKVLRHFLLAAMLVPTLALAQGGTQTGYVKTPGRLENGRVKPGTRIPNATISLTDGRTTRSGAGNGTFTISLPAGKTSFYLKSVQKIGYQLVDREVLSRQHTCSANPLILLMEDPQKQSAYLTQQMNALRQTNVRELRKREAEIQKKQDALDKLKAAKKVSDQEYEQRIKELERQNRKLLAQQENSEKLVQEMAERYASMDFDQIDGFNRRIADCILGGRLEEADSLIRTKGDFNERLQKIRQEEALEAQRDEEIRKQIESNDQAKAGTKASKEDLAQDAYHRFEICKLRNDRDSAAYYLEFRASLDTTNVEWQLDAFTCIIESSDNKDDWDVWNKTRIYSDRLASFSTFDWRYTKEEIEANKTRIQHSIDYFLRRYKNLDKIGYAHALLALGYSYSLMGDFDTCIYFIQEAKEVYINTKEDKIGLTRLYGLCLGMLSPLLKSKAIKCEEQGNHINAIELYEQLLRIYIEVFGERHSDVASCYGNIGVVYAKQEKYSEALEYYQQALSIWKEVLGDKHPNVVMSYGNIGAVYYNQGKYTMALEFFKKALEIMEEKDLTINGVNSEQMRAIVEQIEQALQAEQTQQQ